MKGTVAAMLASALVLVSASDGHAQTPTAVSTSATAQGSAPATRASIVLQISTRGPTAVAATRENEQRQQRVRAALARTGRNVGEVRQMRFAVERESERAGQASGRPFDANTSVLVPNVPVGEVGVVIDSAQAAGATGIEFVWYAADTTAISRTQLLAQALASARDDATALATAAGGRLGRLLHVSTSPLDQVLDLPMQRGGSYVGGFTPSDVSTAVVVYARWEVER
jgi:uncharacterized protein YggE